MAKVRKKGSVIPGVPEFGQSDAPEMNPDVLRIEKKTEKLVKKNRHKSNHQPRRKSRKERQSERFHASEQGLYEPDLDEEGYLPLDSNRRTSRIDSDTSAVTAALSQLTRVSGDSKTSKGKRRRRRGRSRASSAGSFRSEVSAVEATEVAEKRLKRTLSRISQQLSDIGDFDADDEILAHGTRKSGKFQGVDLDQLNETVSKDGEQYLAIDPAQLTAFMQAANDINSDPSQALGLKLEVVNPLAAELQAKGSKQHRRNMKAGQLAGIESNPKKKNRRKKKDGAGIGFCCVLCLVLAGIILLTGVLLIALFFDDIKSFLTAESREDESPDENPVVVEEGDEALLKSLNFMRLRGFP